MNASVSDIINMAAVASMESMDATLPQVEEKRSKAA